MTAAIEQPRVTTPEPDPAAVQERDSAAAQAAELPDLTPETARQLAALLAPHLQAMRAVTAGTRYEHVADGDDAAPVSPAVKIFIAGALQHLLAQPGGDAVAVARR